MSPEKKVADEEGSPKTDKKKRPEEVPSNDNNHNEDDVASDISSNSSLDFDDEEDDGGAKNRVGVNRVVPDYMSDVSSDDLSGRIYLKRDPSSNDPCCYLIHLCCVKSLSNLEIWVLLYLYSLEMSKGHIRTLETSIP